LHGQETLAVPEKRERNSFKSDAATPPNVCRLSVRVALQHFRRQVARGSDSAADVAGDLTGEAEVAQLHSAVARYENVGRFEIPVQHSSGMDVFKGLAHVVHPFGQQPLGDWRAPIAVVANRSGEVAFLAKLHYNTHDEF